MTHVAAARRRLQDLLRRPDAQLDLAEAALCIAWEDQGGGDPAATLRELDDLAAQVRPRLAGLDQPEAQVAVLNGYLFDELGFHGNTANYNDPANSFLDRVLATRSGLPITLSLLYIELGRRLALPIVGVALPGHFLVRYMAVDSIFVDPFNRGRRWSHAECTRQIKAAYRNASAEEIALLLEPPSRHTILERMLRNLKGAYITAENFPRALAVVERLLLFEAPEPAEWRDRGLLRARLGLLHLALEDLERYVAELPDAPDLPALQLQARAIADYIVVSN